MERLKVMPGDDQQEAELFLYGSVEERVPEGHPLRPVRAMADAALKSCWLDVHLRRGRLQYDSHP